MTAERLEAMLAKTGVEPAVFELRPDYTAVLLAAEGQPLGASDEASDAWLREAEAVAVARLAGALPEDRPQVAMWCDAYRAFGAKPQRTRNSLEAHLRRVLAGPRINLLTDLYDALSVLHEVPVGGEDLDCYVLGPDAVATATAAADDLERRLRRLGPLVATARRTFTDRLA